MDLRRRLLLAGWLVGVAVILTSALGVQVLERDEWRGVAARQHKKTVEVPAPRGSVLDRDGTPIAVSRERFRVSVAPTELQDVDHATGLLSQALDLSPRDARRITQSSKRWVVIAGHYPPAVREVLGGVTGIYLKRDLPRYYPYGGLARAVLGSVRDGSGAGGIEQTFDSILRGAPGHEIQARDSGGRPVPGETVLVEAPEPGGQVILTIDMDLQEIAHEALSRQIEATGAQRGDLLITDPRSGEILAMVSLPAGVGSGIASLTTPYEPGSTLKPFTVAAILDNGVAKMSDSVDTGDGTWRIAGRTLHDVHPKTGYLTLAASLRYSSNVGVAMLAQPLTPAQQYENLRDFGFGAITGIGVPGEAAGILRRPDRWTAQSGASLAIGYEISVTPLQMAMAYGALANGGKLMEPRLVSHAKDRRGRTVLDNSSRVVRRVVPKRVTRAIKDVLVEVVEEGTGTRARLETFSVAGKSGTARAYDPKGGYAAGGHFSSFVGFFPADDPQLVIVVKLERPTGSYYGGATAAPVTRSTLEAVLAARRSPIDRAALATAARRVPAATAGSSSPAAIRFAARSIEAPLPIAATPALGDVARVPVPDVAGLTPRAAVRRLHALGLRVTWQEQGRIIGTVPAAGAHVTPGDTVRLRAGKDDDG